MNSANIRDKVFKSWSGISELAIIKEVATKGEHINLCIEYWARKRKISETEYMQYFHDVVENYIKRLLTERLIFKAEQVLRNIKRDVNCFFYQFACECVNDEELSTFVFDYLKRKLPNFETDDEPTLRQYWTLLEQLRACPLLLAKYRKNMPRISIEALLTLQEECRQNLLVELYFTNGNKELLTQLNKFAVWTHLVDSQQQTMLTRWCMHAALDNSITVDEMEHDIVSYFAQWTIEPDMYEYALIKLTQPTDPLKNYFAHAGYFFKDELNDVPTALRRLCTAECLTQHKDFINKLPIAKFLLERGAYNLMLQSFVSLRQLEELCDGAGETPPLRLVIALKKHNLTDEADFMQLLLAVKTYLASTNPELSLSPLVIFYELLAQTPSISELQSFLSYNDVPYLKALAQHFEPAAKLLLSLPTPHELLRKFKFINLDELKRVHPEIASFSNERLCQRYARKYQLNYTHYLKQLRGAYAVYYLIIEQFQLYAQLTQNQLYNATETAMELALQQADNKDFVVHCVAFCEILGFDTQHLRSYLLLRRLLPADVHFSNYAELIKCLDAQLLQVSSSSTEFPLQQYQALLRLAKCVPNCHWPSGLLKRCAAEDDWWHFLVLAQFTELPLNELQKLLPHFKSRTLCVHLLRALSSDNSSSGAERVQRRGSILRQQQHMSLQSSLESVTCRIAADDDTYAYPFEDLFGIILHSSSSNVTTERIDSISKFLEVMQLQQPHVGSDCKLLRQCVKQHLPMLSVLAATICQTNIDWCWLLWLIISTEQWKEFLREATHIAEQATLVWTIIKRAVTQGQTLALLNSFCIFYAQNPFVHFCRFLQMTHSDKFDDTCVAELRLFLLRWSNFELELPLCGNYTRDAYMQQCIQLIIAQLQCNFDTPLQQQRFLDCICRSEMADICSLYDFCLLNQVFKIASTWLHRFHANYELLAQHDSTEYLRLLPLLIEAHAYDVAVELATLLQQPVADIFYAKWIAAADAGELHEHVVYEREVVKYALPPAILVNFYLYVATRELEPCVRKYTVLKRALDVIKQHHLFPNESFDRDQIEYDMILSYLQTTEADVKLETLELYHSEYFEQIMRQERCVLYKSFLELKELAGIEDLSIATKVPLTPGMEERLAALLNALLDKGDIVAALRVQELFEYRPTDLRFIVFCMALAEGFTTIYNMTTKERQLLSDIEKGAFSQFNKRTLQQVATPYRGSSDMSDSGSVVEFEEVPTKEKQQTLETIQGIASKLKHGVELGKRIMHAYRAAIYLDKEYLDVLRTKDVAVLLYSAAEEDCQQRLLVVSDIMNSTRMTAKEIADLLALEFATCIIRPRFYIFNGNQQTQQACKNTDLWGYNIDRDFHLFLELTPNTTMLGNCLLEYGDALITYRKYQDGKPFVNTETFQHVAELIKRYGLPNSTTNVNNVAANTTPPQVLSHKKHNQIYVELLIKAHQCFVHECSMEGIANVLNRTKKLNTLLTKAKSWSLIVRMLIGIARYREMYYCFDALIENAQFESLLGQFSEAEKLGLRQAVLAYLREHNPSNSKELLGLAALHFLMYNELADMWVNDAREVLAKVRTYAQTTTQQSPVCSTKTQMLRFQCIAAAEIQPLLQQALDCYTHATENHLLDNKLLLAHQTAAMAELVAMQIDLVNKCASQMDSSCACVISVQHRDEFRVLVNVELSVPQIIILSQAFGYDVNWCEVLLTQFVVLQRKSFLRAYKMHFQLTDDTIENIVKSYLMHARDNNIAHTHDKNDESLTELVMHIKSVTLKYKMASILGLKAIVMSMINDSAVHYLRDTNFGHSMHHL